MPSEPLKDMARHVAELTTRVITLERNLRQNVVAAATNPGTLRSTVNDTFVRAGFSASVVGDYEIVAGTMLEIESNGVLEIT